MRHYLNENALNFAIKVNSRKQNDVLKRQLIVYFERIDRFFGVNFNNSKIFLQFEYVDDDFPNNKYAKLLTFTEKQ